MWRLQSARNIGRLGLELVKSNACKSQGCSANFVRQYWNKDYEANPEYPVTEPERVAAAKSYGILPEDYKPYPDDGTAFGDYPELPWKGADGRSPWEDWDYPSMRRNFNEPLHLHADILGEDRYQPDAQYRYSMPQMYLILTLVVTVFAGLCLGSDMYKFPSLALEKQYPYKNAYNGSEPEAPKHFTFEPAD